MTPGRARELAIIAGFENGTKEITFESFICTDEVLKLVELAVAEERERCAKIADKYFRPEGGSAELIAAAIRAGGE